VQAPCTAARLGLQQPLQRSRARPSRLLPSQRAGRWRQRQQPGLRPGRCMRIIHCCCLFPAFMPAPQPAAFRLVGREPSSQVAGLHAAGPPSSCARCPRLPQPGQAGRCWHLRAQRERAAGAARRWAHCSCITCMCSMQPPAGSMERKASAKAGFRQNRLLPKQAPARS
jgi:hypothetical protein